jgi:hypothetical protein
MTKSPADKKPKKPPLAAPNFKSEAEEAAWWEAHADYMFERARKFGHLAPPLNVIRTTPISLRVDQDILERAKAIAKEKHLPYQRVLKDAMRAGLDMVGSSSRA